MTDKPTIKMVRFGDERLPERLRLYVERIERDQDYINDMSAKCAALWAEADTLLEQLQKLAA